MNNYTTILRPLLNMLVPRDRRNGLRVIFLLALGSLLDFFSLASFLPIIFLMVNPAFISSNTRISTVYHALGFNTPAAFIVTLTSAVLLLVCVKNVVASWITSAKANYVFQLGSDLSARALSRYMETEYLTFAQVDFTKELNRIANLPIAFANNIVLPLFTLFGECLVLLLLLTGVAVYDPFVFSFLAVILIPTMLLYRHRRHSLRSASRDLKEKYPLSLKYALQVVEGLFEIKAFGKGSYFRDRFVKISRRLAHTFARDHTTQSASQRLTEIAAAFIICSVIVYSVLTEENYQHTLLLLGIYAGVSFRIIPSVNRILNALMQVRTHEYLFKELDGMVSSDLPVTPLPAPTGGFEKSLTFGAVSFRYPDGRDVLKNISMTIAKGDKIALTGRSGSGKTTLLLLLLRFLHEQSGRITVDGRPLTDADGRPTGLFAYVPQNPYILDGTLAENIAFGVEQEHIDRERIEHLIHELDLDDLVAGLHAGLETRIGEKGIRLSGGQRQRIAIARALYADADVFLLDEVTNQADTATEEEVLKALEKIARRDKTIVMITHHEHVLPWFDRIWHLENGVLSESLPVQPLSH
jgi:ABC-type multidrug transport system fused ATPase/permease subunit